MRKRMAVILLAAALLLTGCKTAGQCKDLAVAKGVSELPVRSYWGTCQIQVSTPDGYDSLWIILREVGYGK